jgi:hypothetical protein
MPVIDTVITTRKPYAGGLSFGDAGAYEQIDGTLTFAVDPHHAANDVVVDLDLAPRDRQGRVRFRADFSVLRPLEPARFSGRALVSLVNRGRRLFGAFNRAPVAATGIPGNDPGDGFLFREGWLVASLGWQWDVIRNTGLLGFDAPLVLAEGLPVTGQTIVTIRPNARERTFLLANRTHEPYRPLRLDDANARLYLRDHENGPDTLLPRAAWRFGREDANGSVLPSREHVYMAEGFEPGKVYNLVFEAEGARVVGAGLLGFRDFAAWLRAGDVALGIPPSRWLYGHGVSQTGRLLRHFLYLGLNSDESGARAYDGLLAHVAGGRRGEYNHRFGQPSVSITPGFGGLFPFADDESTDPFSGRSDGLLRRQRERGNMPRVFYTNTSAEYWRGDAALVHVDPSGTRDLVLDGDTRFYHFTGTQHVAGSLPQRDRDPNEGSRGRYGFNVVDYSPLVRAALVNLDAWAREGTEPPPSCHARLADGTLVEADAVLETFRSIPDGTVPAAGHVGALYELDLGPDAGRGIGTYPARLARRYPRFLPAVDADGNELAGVRLPDITVPVATHAGWNPRHPETGSPENIIQMMGSTRYFAATRDERERDADPRPSLAERYASRSEFIARVRQEAQRLVAERFLLPGDVEIVVDNAGQRYDAAIGRGATAPAVG